MYELSLEGKVALVTGGNGGLGESIAIGRQDAGARIAVTGRDAGKNAAVGEKFAAGALVLEVDVREEAAVINAVQRVASEWGASTSWLIAPVRFTAVLSLSFPLKDGTPLLART
jgi:NAD(P)-dependent dehydrogenase (short-subunit alcohol dehydrogenase family)